MAMGVCCTFVMFVVAWAEVTVFMMMPRAMEVCACTNSTFVTVMWATETKVGTMVVWSAEVMWSTMHEGTPMM